MVDLNEARQYTRGEFCDFILDRRLPVNTAQIIIEVDRETTVKRGMYTEYLSIEVFTSDDNKTWVSQGGAGCFGGIVKDPSVPQRDSPVTSGSLAPIRNYQGKYFKIRLTSANAQSVSSPRILIGLG